MKNHWKQALGAVASVAMLASMPGVATVGSTAAESASPVRNIAYRRAAYASDNIGFDQTAQLVTDGLFSVYGDQRVRKTAQHPVSDSPENEQLENLFDGKTSTKYLTFHNTCWVQVRLPDSSAAIGVRSYLVASANDSQERDPENWTLQGSNDDENWTVLDTQTGIQFADREQTKTFTLKETAAYTYYRLDITKIRNPGATSADGQPLMQLSRWDLLDTEGHTVLLDAVKPTAFESVWKAEATAGKEEQYVYVDLGAKSEIQSFKLYWSDDNFATRYAVQVSDDEKTWRDVYTEDKGSGDVESVTLPKAEQARYVRLLCKQSNGDAYALSEWEVYGMNDLTYSVGELPSPEADGTQYLRGGNWKLERASEVSATGEQLSTAGYTDDSWLPATVPGTVLTSYKNAGAVPDMRVADNILQISDSYFTADFWYRDAFVIPKEQEGKRTWLNFISINWKADVYFNGEKLGDIQGAFIRGKFDITALANYGGENYLAVYIHKNDHPDKVDLKNSKYAGHNGGAIVRDNPTIAASVGWDWIPTMPGRNIGIYGDVFVNYTDDVLVADPLVTTKLSNNNKTATLTVKALLSNASDKEVNTVVSGQIQSPSGDKTVLSFDYPVTLPAHTVKQEYTLAEALVLQNPELWWPNTYGDQPLYTMTLTASDKASSTAADAMSFRFGVRELTYDDHDYVPADDLQDAKYPKSQGGPLALYCNGVHIIMRGGNWGMDDANLAATDAEYDVKVRMHAEANFTMIRNWVGMTSNRAFYDACDKYGILIWNDFWLANPIDREQGSPDEDCNPDDNEMFLANAVDNVYRIRRHAALAVYCGRNEGPPPTELNNALKKLTTEQDGSRYYSAFSADNHLTGEGFVYAAQTPSYYFEENLDRQNAKIMQIERGYPNVPAYESIMKMLTDKYAWPINDVWGIHDFCGTDGGYSATDADGYVDKMNTWYGASDNLRDFTRTAQMMNYEGMKALYEGMYHIGREGLLMWMSQSAWPSMIWQTYDYYYDTNGGYFGLKKGTAPLSAYWPNSGNDDAGSIFLRNYTKEDRTGLRVVLDIYDLNGERVHHAEKTMDAKHDTSVPALDIPALEDTSSLRFLKTAVYDGSEQIADNFYWMNADESQDYRELNMLPRIQLTKTVKQLDNIGDNARYQVTITNPTDTPALTVRLKTLDAATGEQMLPVYYDDNYISLMPGESQTITLEIDNRFSTGTPQFELEGWNVVPTDLPEGQLISEPKMFLQSTVNNLYSDAVLKKTAAPVDIGTNGAFVQSFSSGSMAKIIGLQENDIITKYNGYTVTGSVALASLYALTPDNDPVTLKVWRGDRYIRVDFTKNTAENRLFAVPNQIEGEAFSEVDGVEIRTEVCGEGGRNLSNISNGDVAIYKNVLFAAAPQKVVLRAATEIEGNPVVTMRLDSRTGPVIASASITKGQWQTYNSYEITLTDEQKKLLTGVHDVYLSFTGSMNINWFSFTAPEATETVYTAADPEAPVGTPLLGNLDGDRAITAVDALMALQAAAGKIKLDTTRTFAADVNGDNAVTASDALQILQNATNKVTDLHTS